MIDTHPQPLLRTATLGCKVNQYETEWLREGLVHAGYRDARADEPAQLCVVNTCTVTGAADAKSRQLIRRLARDNPDARIVVMGCYATRAATEIARLPGVSEVITDKRELPDWLARMGAAPVPNGVAGFAGRRRAMVKVQDGCLLRCSYCIIPLVRPHMYSRPLDAVLAEIRQLVANQYREIVLTGIHLGHYGVDFNRGRPKSQWTRLSHLLRAICELEGSFRVRLSSIEATEVTRPLIEVMAEYPTKVCPHLHVCLQSGSDRILSRMQRRWSARRIIDRCAEVQAALDRPALTTDVIVGFPGESDADFAQTLDACRQIGFTKIHVFPYSRRRGTPAADMPHQVPDPVKRLRVEQVSRLEVSLRRRYFASLVGRPLDVLVESASSGRGSVPTFSGTACRAATVDVVDDRPAPSSRDMIGELVRAVVVGDGDDRLHARRIDSP